jgi:NRPS condensation-like uncharacterized protein
MRLSVYCRETPTFMQDRLNSYQKTMLQWNSLHPYNSAHVLRIGVPLEFEKLQKSVNEVIQTHGLADLSLDRNRRTYLYHAGPAQYGIKLIVDEDPQTALVLEIERQLNIAFPDSERFQPFRFFVVPEECGFYFGLVFFHAIADGETVVTLIRDIFDVYMGRDINTIQAFDLYPGRYDGLLRRPALLVRKLVALRSHIRKLSTSCRVPYGEHDDRHIRVTFLSLKHEKLDLLLRAAKSLGVTVNDLLLALMMKCLAPACEEHKRPNRGKISIGCVVNARNDLGLANRRKFGLFLGGFVATHAIPTDIGLTELVKDIHRQVLAIKKTRLYLATSLEMAVGRFMYSLYSTKRRNKFYQKFYPLWGGISNMNLNRLWAQQPSEKQVDYLRAVSTDPVNHLVLSVTTFGSVMNIGLCSRSAVLSPAQIEELKTCFLESLEQLA